MSEEYLKSKFRKHHNKFKSSQFDLSLLYSIFILSIPIGAIFIFFGIIFDLKFHFTLEKSGPLYILLCIIFIWFISEKFKNIRSKKALNKYKKTLESYGYIIASNKNIKNGDGYRHPDRIEPIFLKKTSKTDGYIILEKYVKIYFKNYVKIFGIW